MLKKIQAFDEKLINGIGKLHTPILNKVMLFMTFLGDSGKVWFFAFALFWIFNRKPVMNIAIMLSMGLGFLMAEIIVKRIVCRVRPCHKIDEELLLLKKMPHFYSFPSSHSCTSFAVAAASFLLCSSWVTAVILVVAIGISFSRFYLQAHYLTDVLCGIVLGILCSLVMVRLVYFVAGMINPAFIKY
ncbi:MAG: phosphatase PAP2 family protein [Lachnospiraceae bacterium]|nr:phosphatase PAP2 family protein [Lachnospiraceae bacterium]